MRARNSKTPDQHSILEAVGEKKKKKKKKPMSGLTRKKI